MGRRIKFLLFLMTLHGSLLITSTVAGSKLFALPFGLTASATVVSYMLTFVVLDVIAELYGAEFSRLVAYLASQYLDLWSFLKYGKQLAEKRQSPSALWSACWWDSFSIRSCS